MTVGGRRRPERRGEREKENFAREHQNEIELAFGVCPVSD